MFSRNYDRKLVLNLFSRFVVTSKFTHSHNIVNTTHTFNEIHIAANLNCIFATGFVCLACLQIRLSVMHVRITVIEVPFLRFCRYLLFPVCVRYDVCFDCGERQQRRRRHTHHHHHQIYGFHNSKYFFGFLAQGCCRQSHSMF